MIRSVLDSIGPYLVNGGPTKLLLFLGSTRQGRTLVRRIFRLHIYQAKKEFKELVKNVELDTSVNIEDYRWRKTNG